LMALKKSGENKMAAAAAATIAGKRTKKWNEIPRRINF
jgi:hypothetical protein